MAFKREPKTVFTFSTTTFAMEAERLCREKGLPGRLIPVPTSISAGCGLSWCAPPEAAGDIEKLLTAEHAAIEGIYNIEI